MAERQIKQERKPISIPQILYDVILFGFIVTNYLAYISFTRMSDYTFYMLERRLNRAILLVMFAHLCMTAGELIGRELIKENKKKALPMTGVYLIATAALSYFILKTMPGMAHERFYTLIGVYLIAFMGKRPFRRTAAVFLAAYAGIFLVASLGVPLGYTKDAVRLMDYGAKHTFGLVHPNTAAHIVFVIVFCVRYLFLRGKVKATFALFWGVAAFLLLTNRCRTVIILLFAFPILWRLCGAKTLKRTKSAGMLIALFPVICLAITLLLCIPIDLIHRLTYDNFLFSIGERFVQAGITIRTHGMPLLGRSIDTSRNIKMMVDGEKITLFAVDNAFVSYGVIRGLVWLAPSIGLLCLANFKAWERKDYALMIYGLLACVFAIMERRGLNPAFNMMFYYPLPLLWERGRRYAGQDRRDPHRIRL